MRSNLIDAIKSHNKAFIEGYLETISIDDLMDDLRALIDGNESGDDLKDFTMAAMQGLITGLWTIGGPTGHGWSREEIAIESIEQAKSTLSELQKQQS